MNETKTRHIQEAQRSGSTAERRLTQQRFKQSELYRVPSELISEIFFSITF